MEERKEWAELESHTLGSLRTLPNHYTTKAEYVVWEKSFLFNAFSIENRTANAIKDDRAA